VLGLLLAKLLGEGGDVARELRLLGGLLVERGLEVLERESEVEDLNVALATPDRANTAAKKNGIASSMVRWICSAAPMRGASASSSGSTPS
jgi:hypothetical protein